MSDNRFRQQFLFTKESNFALNWKNVKIDDFYLYYHDELIFTESKSVQKRVILLGSLYDWEFPNLSNQEILDYLVKTESFDFFLKVLSKYLGEYIIIYKEIEKIFLINDVTGQQQIYYDTDFCSFGSQPKLLCEVITPEPHTDPDMIDFYNSEEFQKSKLFIWDTCHLGNVKHLIPNHYIDLKNKKQTRFYPIKPLIPVPTKETVPLLCEMLKGYMKSISKRKKMALPFTAGVDSRVLFFASLETDCVGFIYKYNNMTDKYHDISIPKKISERFNRPFEVISHTGEYENLNDSIDFPARFPKFDKYFRDRMYLNGNIGDFTRRPYGNKTSFTGQDVAFLRKFYKTKSATKIFSKMILNKDDFTKYGYEPLDMYAFEVTLASQIAKGKTETKAVGIDEISPFNSRDFLDLCFATPLNDRNYNYTKLFHQILLHFSPKALDFPINPHLNYQMKSFLTRIGIFDRLKFISKNIRKIL